MLCFLIAGKHVLVKFGFISTAWQNALHEPTQEELLDITLKKNTPKTEIVEWRLHGSPLTFLTNPQTRIISCGPEGPSVLHVAQKAISAWPRLAGVTSSASSQPSLLLPDQTKPPASITLPFVRPEAHTRAPLTCGLQRGRRYKWRWS